MVVFFFKQKTAYEVRISDWSSDVCSSDLFGARQINTTVDLSAVDTTGYFDEAALQIGGRHALLAELIEKVRYVYRQNFSWVKFNQIGRASCRERVCQYV